MTNSSSSPSFPVEETEGIYQKYTVNDLRNWGACYDPVTGIDAQGCKVNEGYLSEDWQGNVLDILRTEKIPAVDRLWAVLRVECINIKTLREFAIWCAKEALALVDNPDKRSIEACNVAERFINGEATLSELRDANVDAKEAVDEAIHSRKWIRWAAFKTVLWASKVEVDPCRVASWAESTFVWAYYHGVLEYSTAREKQVKKLITILEGGTDHE